MNQSEEKTFSDQEIKDAVASIYNENSNINIKESDLITALKVKLRISLNDQLPEEVLKSAKEQLEELMSSTIDTSQEVEKKKLINDIISMIVRAYNGVIATTKGTLPELHKEFSISIDRKSKIDNDVLNDLFSAMYGFYNKKRVPPEEINDITKLSIANPIQPSKFKRVIDTIFCCGRKSRYARHQEIFMTNIKVVAQVISQQVNSSKNNLSTISEIKNDDKEEENFVGSYKPDSFVTNFINNAMKKEEENFLDELKDEEQAKDIGSYKTFVDNLKNNGNQVIQRG